MSELDYWRAENEDYIVYEEIPEEISVSCKDCPDDECIGCMNCAYRSF